MNQTWNSKTTEKVKAIIMPKITFQGKTYLNNGSESVLDTLRNAATELPYSCGSGICQICLLRLTQGQVNPESQSSLRPTLSENGYFKACKCVPSEDIEVELPKQGDIYGRAMVRGKDPLSANTLRLIIEPATPLFYHAGQFINLRHPDGQVRSYSIASVANIDFLVELHIKRISGGKLSNWIFSELQIGDPLDFQGPFGSNFYTPDHAGANILMLAAGAGAAPLIGISRDALNSGHSGEIHFFHGGPENDDLYATEIFEQLAKEHKNFHYTLCADDAAAAAFSQHQNLDTWKVHIAGNPDMVTNACERAEKSGVNPLHIYVDPFNPDGEPDITHK